MGRTARLATIAVLAGMTLSACASDRDAPEEPDVVAPEEDGDPQAPSEPPAEPDPEPPEPEPEPEPERFFAEEPGSRPYTELPENLVLTRELVAEMPEQVTALAVRLGDDRLFAGDKQGTVWVVDGGERRSEAFLDISDQVLGSGQTSEQGLLSIAFHPDDSDRLFVYYVTEGDDDTRLSEFRVAATGDHADIDSERIVLDVEQPFRWHNGGHLVFGPDGMLWLSLGDGGLSGDPSLNAQNPGNLLGSIIRIDVDGDDPYAIPDDNPFADGDGGAPEVWAYGLRNPWRMAFDPVEWRLYITDVGQFLYEWVNVIGHDEAGVNFGWPIREGSNCFADHRDRCPGDDLTDPVHEYERQDECAIIGAHVYDGALFPDLAGHFFYTDFCAGWLRSFRYHDGEVRDERDWSEQVDRFDRPVAVGADADGELLVSDGEGSIWRIVPG